MAWDGRGVEASPGRAPDDPGRRETEAERDDRGLAELLQELRVAGLGVQVLFGFLLSLPFTVRFVKLSGSQRGLYLVSLLAAAAATALLGAPVAYHRLTYRRHLKGRLLRAAGPLALAGLGAVALAVTCAVILVASFVLGPAAAALVGVGSLVGFGGLWFGLPLRVRWSVPAPDDRPGRAPARPRDPTPG
jgi:hypothetical protein